MRAANPDELNENAFPVMTARLTEGELTEWFPISFEEISDPWAAPEPSKGALVKLDAGEYVVLDYGKDSSQLTVRIPSGIDASECLASLFREVPLPTFARALAAGRCALASACGCKHGRRAIASQEEIATPSASPNHYPARRAPAPSRHRSRRRPGPACA